MGHTTRSPSPTSLPAASLIICSRNRPELLATTVQSVLEGDEVPSELVMVDQSDVPHPALVTLATSRPCTIRYLWTHSIGVSRARNAGIEAAQHAILAFTDDDVVVAPTWFGALARALLQAGPRAAVTGRVLPLAEETHGGFAPSTKVEESPATYEGRLGADVLFANNMAFYRTAIKLVGSFDERLGPGTSFPGSEDNDFGFRLLEAGFRIAYVPEAVLYHRAWRSEDHYLPLRWRYGRGQGAFYAKHLSVRDRHMVHRMGHAVVGHTLAGLFRIRRQPRLAYGDAIYTLGLLSGAAQWLLTQRHSP